MKETLIKFSYEITGNSDDDNTGDIHIEGDDFNMFETLCGSVSTGQKQIDTDKMPTCEGCLNTYNMIKNGKLRN